MDGNARIKVYEQMAEYFRTHGFSPSFGNFGGPRCFLGVLENAPVGFDCAELAEMISTGDNNNFGADSLRRNGWNTDDAIAACEIAAAITPRDK